MQAVVCFSSVRLTLRSRQVIYFQVARFSSRLFFFLCCLPAPDSYQLCVRLNSGTCVSCQVKSSWWVTRPQARVLIRIVTTPASLFLLLVVISCFPGFWVSSKLVFFFPRYAPFTLFVVFHTPYKPTDSTYYPVTTMIYSVTLSAANGTGVKIQEPGMFKRLTRITKPTEAAHEAEQDSFQPSLLFECLPLGQKEWRSSTQRACWILRERLRASRWRREARPSSRADCSPSFISSRSHPVSKLQIRAYLSQSCVLFSALSHSALNKT